MLNNYMNMSPKQKIQKYTTDNDNFSVKIGRRQMENMNIGKMDSAIEMKMTNGYWTICYQKHLLSKNIFQKAKVMEVDMG